MKACKTKYCHTPAKRGNYCYKCQKRQYRENNPLRAAWQNWKDNAKRRSIQFDITFEQFQYLATQTKLLLGRGRTKEAYHIDRIDESKGYTLDNIQRLTATENVQKEHERRRKTKTIIYNYESKQGYFIEKANIIKTNDCPF